MRQAKLWLFALALLVATPTGAGIIMGPFSLGPTGPVVLWQMDFEGSGCTDTDSDTCSSAGGTGYDGDYTGGAAPLNGVYSALHGNASFIYADAKFDSGTNDVTLDARVYFNVHSNLGSTKAMYQLWGGGAFRCAIVGRPDNRNMWAYTGQSGAGITVAEGVEYRLRMEWNRTSKLCKVYLDLTSSDYGTGGVGSSQATNISWTPGSLNGFRMPATGTVRMIQIIDDISICEGINLGPANCGD
jgi:hypothetical protein